MFVKALGIDLYDLIPGTMYEFGVQIVKDSQATLFSESVFNQQTLVHNYLVDIIFKYRNSARVLTVLVFCP